MLDGIKRMPARPVNQPALSFFIWSVANLMRGDFKQSEYGNLILPFSVLRRFDAKLTDKNAT